MRVTAEMVEKAARAHYNAVRMEDGAWDEAPDAMKRMHMQLMRTALETAFADCPRAMWGAPQVIQGGSEVHLWSSSGSLHGKFVALVPLDSNQ